MPPFLTSLALLGHFFLHDTCFPLKVGNTLVLLYYALEEFVNSLEILHFLRHLHLTPAHLLQLFLCDLQPLLERMVLGLQGIVFLLIGRDEVFGSLEGVVADGTLGF